MIPPPEVVEETVVIPNAVIRMDKKQTVSAEVDGRIEIIGSPLPPGSQFDPKEVSYDPNDHEKKLPFRRLRIGDTVMKGQTVSLMNDLDVLVQIEAAYNIIVASNKAIKEATIGADKIDEQLKLIKNLGPATSTQEILNAEATLARYRENIFTSERELAKADGDKKRAEVLRAKHRCQRRRHGRHHQHHERTGRTGSGWRSHHGNPFA